MEFTFNTNVIFHINNTDELNSKIGIRIEKTTTRDVTIQNIKLKDIIIQNNVISAKMTNLEHGTDYSIIIEKDIFIDYKGLKYDGNNNIPWIFKTNSWSMNNINETGAIGDPYINPIYGNKYKLPDIENVYRYLDNNDLNNRLLININCWKLSLNKRKELLKYIYNSTKKRENLLNNNQVDNWLINNNLKITDNGIFINYLYLLNNDSYILFDFEEFKIIKSLGNNIKIDNDSTKTINYYNYNIENYNNIKPSNKLTIKTFNNSYGEIFIELLKYDNPQIRNGYIIKTQNPINMKNSRGAMLGLQDINDISLNDIKSEKQILSFLLLTNNKNKINELFINEKKSIKEQF